MDDKCVVLHFLTLMMTNQHFFLNTIDSLDPPLEKPESGIPVKRHALMIQSSEFGDPTSSLLDRLYYFLQKAVQR